MRVADRYRSMMAEERDCTIRSTADPSNVVYLGGG
jgi:hypothetical protein